MAVSEVYEFYKRMEDGSIKIYKYYKKQVTGNDKLQ